MDNKTFEEKLPRNFEILPLKLNVFISIRGF